MIAHAAVPRTVTMPTGYRGAFVRQAQLISEPRRIPGDAASYAHYNLSMSLWWVAKPE